MSSEVLVPGLRFAKKHSLTQKEIEVLVPFLEKPYTTAELADVLKVNKTTLHHIIQRLKLKSLLVLKNRDEKGTNLYEFNLSQLAE
jgi:DNA-binding MarR family transcriptional regulator